MFGLVSLGAFAVFFVMIALAYAFLALPVVTYGSKMIFLQAVRMENPILNGSSKDLVPTTLI